MKVTVTTDDEVKVFDNVTKIEGLCAFDMFTNYVTIHQGYKKTKFPEWKLIDYIVEEVNKNDC